MRIIITLAFLQVYLLSFSQTPSSKFSPPLKVAAAKEAGMSTERLERIDKMLSLAVEENQIPGAVALIARDGKIVYHKAFGYSDVMAGKAMEKDAIFRIASQTKAITATAVMILREEGLFRLDDPISKYIPEFKNSGILDSFNPADSSFSTTPADKEISIRYLLTHISN